MRRAPALFLLGFALVAAALTARVAQQALRARDQLTAAQALAHTVRRDLDGGDPARARTDLVALRAHLDRAEAYTREWTWTALQRLPLLGGNLAAVRGDARAGRLLGDSVPHALRALDLVRGGALLRDGRVDLAQLGVLQQQVRAMAALAEQAEAQTGARHRLLLPLVARRSDQARDLVRSVGEALHGADRALQQAPALLGADGPRRYYVAVQNNAEARATGGLVGAFALLRADRGALVLERTGTDTELRVAARPVPADPEAATSWQATGSTRAWFDANLTPHFPDAARNLAGQWQAQSGQQVDGVVALDPLVMAELLKATGPVRLPDGYTVGASTAVAFVGHDEYVRYRDVAARKRLLGALADRLLHAVLAARDPERTAQALLRAGRSGHLLLWSARPAEQAQLDGSLVAGALPAAGSPYLQVLTQNLGGNKLDYYLRRAVTVTRAGPGLLRVSVVLTNTAPAGLPDYMTVRSDRPVPPVPYAQAKVGLSVYGGKGSEFAGVTRDGRPAPMAFDLDHGHRFGTLSLEVPRGQSVTVTVLLTEPPGELVYRQQPLVTPDALRFAVPHRVLGR